MNILIEKFKNKCVIKCKFDERIFTVLQKSEKKFWNKEKIEWSLPIEALQQFTNEISQIDGVKIDIKECRPHAILIENLNNYELKFAQFINQFDQFKSIDKVVYDNENKKLIIPFEKVSDILELLNKQNITYSVSKNDKTCNSTVNQIVDQTDNIIENEKENEKKILKRKTTIGRPFKPIQIISKV